MPYYTFRGVPVLEREIKRSAIAETRESSKGRETRRECVEESSRSSIGNMSSPV
jgi:hypothetical protein